MSYLNESFEKKQNGESRLSTCIFLGLGVLISVYAFWGMLLVPFHPDESTYLFMSGDFNAFIHAPHTLAWSPDQDGDNRARYRLIDPPLPRYFLGLALSVGNQSPLSSDWDWSKTWDENEHAGALPSQMQLVYGRGIFTLLIPLDLLLVYAIGKRLQNGLTGGLAMILFGTNALILLHARRAMTEGLLIFGILLTLWIILNLRKLTWLMGLGMALALNSKLSALALFPACLAACVQYHETDEKNKNHLRTGHTFTNWLIFMIAIISATILLNPTLWKQPAAALEAAFEIRGDLLERQKSDFTNHESESQVVLGADRLAATLANLFLVPPAFAETGNYLDELHLAGSIYSKIPGHNLLRGIIPGSLMMVMCLFGIIIAFKQMGSANHDQRQAIQICMLANISLAVVCIILMELPWQRYILPLVPFTSLWSAYGCAALIKRRVKLDQKLLQGIRD